MLILTKRFDNSWFAFEVTKEVNCPNLKYCTK